MKPVEARVAIEMELAGPGPDWTDVSRDVRLDASIRAEYGIQGTSPNDRVAGTGSLTFALDNSEANSAGRIGYYSPNHPDVRPGFGIGIPVRLVITYDGVAYVKFLGTLDSVQPVPGVAGERRVLCTALDWMDEAARTQLVGLPTQIGRRSDEVFRVILAAIRRQPRATSIGIGMETYAYALDQSRDERTTALSEFQRLALSELGLAYVRGDGTLVFEDRRRRGTTVANVEVIDGSRMVALTATRSRGDIVNRVQMIAHPRRVDTAHVVLFSLESTPRIESLGTLTLLGSYRDPAQRAARVGGTDLQPLAPGADYLANAAADGSGDDLTPYVRIEPHFGGAGVRFDIRNVAEVDAYVTRLRCRGRGIYDYENARLTAEDSQSQDRHGENAVTLDMPYQSAVEVAQEAARYVLGLYRDPLTVVDRVTLVGNASPADMRAVLEREISDRIGIAEEVTGLSPVVPGSSTATRGYFINGVQLVISEAGHISASWALAPADATTYWLLGKPGASELGQTTHLGYGRLFTEFWVLGGSNLGRNTRVAP